MPDNLDDSVPNNSESDTGSTQHYAMIRPGTTTPATKPVYPVAST
jgi:hypothetical protein